MAANSPANAAEPWDPFGQLHTAPPEPRKKKDTSNANPAQPQPSSTEGGNSATPEYGTGIPYGNSAGSPEVATQPGYGGTAAPTDATQDDVMQLPRDPASPANAVPSAYTTAPANYKASTAPLPPLAIERGAAIEKGDLAPVAAADGSGLPYELWTGLDIPALEGLISRVDIPPHSPAVHQLWRRLITASVTAPGGIGSDGRFNALRAEALYRSGLLDEASKAAGSDASALAANPGLAALAAKIEIGLGNTARACDLVKGFIARKADLPKKIQGEALLMTGICAAAGGNPSGAGLAAEFARQEKTLTNGPDDVVSLAALDAIASGQKTPARGLKSVSLLQYRAFSFAGGVEAKDIGQHGEPALLAFLAGTKDAPPALQLLSAEAAARVNAITPSALAGLYQALGAQMAPEALAAANSVKAEPPLHRAALFKAAEAERTPLKKVRIMRALLDDAKRAGLYLQALSMLSKTADGLQPVPEIGWFAETGIEISLAAGNLERARQWSVLGGSVPGDGGLRHWQALIDIADPALKTERGRSLASVEDLAAKGRLSRDLLHRLATVLDANDTNVPIPLWDAANRAPQPAGGYLPETGVLTSLQDASKKKEFGRTVLLVMRALGPNGAEGAHLIALGDSIRALRRAGLDGDARRLSFEALFALWPRSAGN
ncbi:MAG: hypothetical protein ABL901_08650 [Hyphomicrobiaceae bacterium]